MENIYLKNRILAADPVELIHILYEHAIVQVVAARAAVASGDIIGRSKAVAKTIAILGELEGSLNHEVGGFISQNLGRLYQFMRKRLIDGNLKQDAAALSEVESLLRTLDEGWTAMQKAEITQHSEAPLTMAAKASSTLFTSQSEEVHAAHTWDA